MSDIGILRQQRWRNLWFNMKGHDAIEREVAMARVCRGRSVSGCRRIHIFDVIPKMEAHPDSEKLNECLAWHDSPARICAPVGVAVSTVPQVLACIQCSRLGPLRRFPIAVSLRGPLAYSCARLDHRS